MIRFSKSSAIRSSAAAVITAFAAAFLQAAPTACALAQSKKEITFKKTVLSREFRSEGVAVADVNRDGRADILAGNLWYEAPTWTPHEIAPLKPFDAAKGYSESFQNFAADVNRDGWADQIVITFPGKPAVWRENPKNAGGHWREHVIWRSACNESPTLVDLLGDGKRVLVFAFDDSQMAWYEPNKDATREFTAHIISEKKAPGTNRYAHGLGVGDVNGDGRADVLTTKGYYEAPADRRRGPWRFVPADLGPDAAQMYVMDVNRDGLADVVSSSSHDVGVWWHEQKRRDGGTAFVRHTIDNSFSQSHALEMADIDRDGSMDFVTGKRFWAHGPEGDVNPGDPAVLNWFELRRGSKGAVEWVRHEIDRDSGVGTQFVVADVNGDGRPDVVTANKKGVFLFEQQRR